MRKRSLARARRRAEGGRGPFITLEGVEGAGKTTRCRALLSYMQRHGIPHIHTREPGGPPVAEGVRELLLNPDLDIPPMSEVMLYLASRAANVELVVRPALESGRAVVCERYSDATMAYQVGGRGLPEEPVRRANALATGGLVPDLTILLDLSPEEGLSRLGRQGREPDRIERESLEFHRRVRDYYRRTADREDRFLVVDAALSGEEQDRIIGAAVRELLGIELTTEGLT